MSKSMKLFFAWLGFLIIGYVLGFLYFVIPSFDDAWGLLGGLMTFSIPAGVFTLVMLVLLVPILIKGTKDKLDRKVK